MNRDKQQLISRMMKAGIKAEADQIKILRKFERHCARMSAEKRKSNSYNAFDKTREQTYTYRKALSKQARYSGLARQFVRGVPYLVVENSVKEGNFPKVQEIYEALSEWGVAVDNAALSQWLFEGAMNHVEERKTT